MRKLTDKERCTALEYANARHSVAESIAWGFRVFSIAPIALMALSLTTVAKSDLPFIVVRLVLTVVMFWGGTWALANATVEAKVRKALFTENESARDGELVRIFKTRLDSRGSEALAVVRIDGKEMRMNTHKSLYDVPLGTSVVAVGVGNWVWFAIASEKKEAAI